VTGSLLEKLGWRKYVGKETGTYTGEPVLGPRSST
jgi:hypothetical protein